MSFAEDVKSFLGVPFNKYLTIGLVLLGTILLFNHYFASTPAEENNRFTVDFFYLPTCPHCNEQKPFNEKLMGEFPNVNFVYHDASHDNELQLLLEMATKHNLSRAEIGVPATFFGNQSFIGYESEETTGKRIRDALVGCLKECSAPTQESSQPEREQRYDVSVPLIGTINAKQVSLPLLAVILGLVDGFNPCAMWVLVYLIALVLELKDKKKIWFIVGTFVFASGVLYFLFMTAWLNAFLVLGYVRAVSIIIGLVALGGGILSIKEYIETKGDLQCKVGSVDDKKKTMKRAQELISAPLNFATMIGIIALAFVVNSVEFVCSAAIPAVFTQVLALSNLSFIEHYAYILLYVIMFMLDDLVIFGLAAMAVTGGIGEKYAKHCKIIGGVIMLALGLMILFAPQLLR